MTIPRGIIPGRNQYGDILNGSQTFEKIQVDNIKLDGNTISATNTNGDINISSYYTGKINMSSGSAGFIILAGSSPGFSLYNAIGGTLFGHMYYSSGTAGMRWQNSTAHNYILLKTLDVDGVEIGSGKNITLMPTNGGSVNISASGLQMSGVERLTSAGYHKVPSGDGTGAPNGSLYIDSTTGDLMFKDDSGSTHTVVDIA